MERETKEIKPNETKTETYKLKGPTHVKETLNRCENLTTSSFLFLGQCKTTERDTE